MVPDTSAIETRTGATDDAWPIVGVGASAGGLEALQALVKGLSCRNMGLIVTQHLSPTHESLLTEILARSTSLEVVTASEGMAVQKGRIHVLPGGADLAIEGGLLKLSPTQGLGARLPIDAFLRSLASDRGAQAVGVLLSGGGSDGTAGLRAIQAHGGLTYAQDPESSAHPSMPRSAVEAGVVDFVLTPTEIAAALMRVDGNADPDRSPSADPDALRALFAGLRGAFGVDFTEYKPVTIHRRIERRMMLAGIGDLPAYERRTRSDSDELGALYRDLLIHVTGFFREPEVFEALRTVVFPRLAARAGAAAPLRIWVAGCSTGEEAYSVGMSVLEHLDDREPRPDARIFATDLDDEAIASARIGSYPREIEKNVSAERLQRFFTRLGAGYRVSYALRDMVVFASHDLTRDPPFSHVDLVTCRNVLIYMQPVLQRRLLSMFHAALRPSGFLVLGSSEGLGAASDLFVPVAGRQRVFAKKAAAVTATVGHAERLASTWRSKGSPRNVARVSDLVARTEQQVLERYGPPGILVTPQHEVIHCRGRMAPFLAPASTPPTVDALRLVRPELVAELTSVLAQTLEAGTPALSRALPLPGSRGVQSVVLETIPISSDDDGGRCALVLFREQAPHVAWEPHEVGEAAARVQELEQTLSATRDYLHRRVQQADSAGQLRSAESEELQAANEELQSSNEELESSREELQSTNEELATVNAELQSSLSQLGQSNDDLLNLLAAFDVPIVIIGVDLRIRRFTAAAARLFDLITADVGRSVTHLKSFVDLTDIERIADEVIRTGAPQEREVQDGERRWFVMRVLPYRASDDTVRGAVIELVRASPMRKPGRAGEIHDYAAQILSSLPRPMAMLDAGTAVVWANDAFAAAFGDARAPPAVLRELWKEVPGESWARIEGVLASGARLDGLEARVTMASGELRRVLLSLQRAPSEGRRWVLLSVCSPGSDSAVIAGATV
jgi:two-component system CheB/CheR fusion protein